MLPAALRRFRGRPVVGAKELLRRARAARSCAPDPGLQIKSMGRAWLSTDGLSVEYLVEGSPPLVACGAVRRKGRWASCAFGVARSRDARRIELAGGGLDILCSRPGKPLAFMWIAVPRKAPWALVDHRSFWVAYRSRESRRIHITATHGIVGSSLSVRVAFLDGRGRELAEKTATGYVAG